MNEAKADTLIHQQPAKSYYLSLLRSALPLPNLTHANWETLLALCQEVQFTANQVIVHEGELVDSIYIIIDGCAEVSKKTIKFGIKKSIPIALLNKGENIGLSETGFYSKSGHRTATVTAITNMTLLRLDIKVLNDFLKQHQIDIGMLAASEEFLKMLLIKKALPFSQLSNERINWLAKHITKKTVPQNTIIFKQGDRGTECYLIQSGEIKLFTKSQEEVKDIATLKTPMLFGEATLITHSPRNATALSITECEVFVLEHSYLSELIETEQNVAKMFMSLTVDRSRPLRNPQVSIHKIKSADQQEFTILKNHTNGTYFKLSPEGAFIWQQLNGEHTLQDITIALSETHNIFAPDIVAALVSKLTQAGYIQNLNMTELEDKVSQSFFIRTITRLQKILDFRFAFGDADRWLTKTYNHYIKYFYSLPIQILLCITVIFGFIAFCLDTPTIIFFFSEKHASLWLLLTLLPFSIFSITLHELAHAFTVKAYGREVHYMGIGWYWLVPIAFTDTSDMWLAEKKPRMMVNLAGIFVDLLLGSITALLILLFQHYPYIQCMLWLFALYNYIHAIRMLSPFQEMDGYYILMDGLDQPRLRHNAVEWIVKEFPKGLRHPKRFLQKADIYWPAMVFWITGIVFLIIITFLTLLIEYFAFKIFGLTNPNPYFSTILPVLVVIFSCLGIFADIRNQSYDA